MDFDDENVLDIADYRQIVLEIILSGKHVSQPVARLRLLLFIRAAIYYYSQNQNQCLEPFPSCFFDRVTNTRLYDDLRTHILNVPQLHTIQIIDREPSSKFGRDNGHGKYVCHSTILFQESTSLPELTWKLLHWIFTNPLDIKAITDPAIRNVLTDDLREKTKLSSIPYPSNTCTLYRIRPPVPKDAFMAAKKVYGSFYGYHGSPAQNFHSIIHRGLISSLNVVGAYGYGTYLSSDLNTAKNYANKSRNLQTNNSTENLSALKEKHETGNSYCIAIVEVVNHPDIKVVDVGARYLQPAIQQINGTHDYDKNSLKYYVVARDEYMQLRNLLLSSTAKVARWFQQLNSNPQSLSRPESGFVSGDSRSERNQEDQTDANNGNKDTTEDICDEYLLVEGTNNLWSKLSAKKRRKLLGLKLGKITTF